MEISELRQALRSGVPLIWQGRMDYECSVGRLSGIILRSGANGEDVFSCELTDRRGCVVICRPEEVRYYDPTAKTRQE